MSAATVPLRRPAADRWSLWSTTAFLAVEEPALLPEARQIADVLLADVTQACSRFVPDSDLSRANARAGRWVEAGPLLVAATATAVRAAQATDGLVDPCLGRPLVSLGYDRDLAELTPIAAPHGAPASLPSQVIGGTPLRDAWKELRWREDAICVPAGVALDLGATAKAFAADLVAETVADLLECRTVVALGGDVRVVDPSGTERPWRIRVTERPGDRHGVEVEVHGAIATSTTLVRRWRSPEGHPRHHLLDPRSGLPVSGPFRTATALGATAVAANTATTAALVLGAHAPQWLAEREVTARLVTVSGVPVPVAAWPADAVAPVALDLERHPGSDRPARDPHGVEEDAS